MSSSFLATLLRRGDVIDELPLTDVSYTRRLGGSTAGDLQAKLLLVDEHGSFARAQSLLDATTPWRCAVFVESDGELRWGGPIISRPYQSGAGTVELKAGELGAYFGRRSLPIDRTYAATDQLTIQRNMYADAMAQPGGDVGLQLGALLSGVVRARTYLAATRKPVEQASAELSAVLSGFDYAWRPVRVGGVPRIELQQGYPTLGADQSVSFEYPGDVTSFSFPDEGSALATMSWALGSKDDATGLAAQASSTATALLDADFPLLERIESYTDVSDAGTLQAHADADLRAQAGTTTQIDLEMTLPDMIDSGVQLGNIVRFRATDPARFPLGLDIELRCIAITERPLDGTATISCADRLLQGGRLPSMGSSTDLLAGLARRVLRVEAS